MTSCTCNRATRCAGTGVLECRWWGCCFCPCGCEDEECFGCDDCNELDDDYEDAA